MHFAAAMAFEITLRACIKSFWKKKLQCRGVKIDGYIPSFNPAPTTKRQCTSDLSWDYDEEFFKMDGKDTLMTS